MDRRRVLLVVAIVVAALGAGLVFFYAQGADDRASAQFETQTVIVATQEIKPGESASDAANAGKLLSVAVPQDQLLAGSTNDGNAFKDAVALTTIYPGEQLIPAKFGTADEVEGQQLLSLPPGKIAIQISLSDTGRVGAFTRPGSRVVLFATPTDATAAPGQTTDQTTGQTGDQTGDQTGTSDPTGTGQTGTSSQFATKVLLPNLLVLAVGSTTTQPTVVDQNGNAIEATPVTNLTIAVSEDEAKLILDIQTLSTLTFGLRDDNSKIQTDVVVDDNATGSEGN